MEIREFFIIAFNEAQPLGEQLPEEKEHFTFIGYIRDNSEVEHRFTIAEHMDRIAVKRLELPGKKLRRLGRFTVTVLDDPTGELISFKDELFKALIEDGYRCTRSSFYGENYKPHVSMGKFKNGGPQPRKLKSFPFNNLSLTESRFDLDYDFLGSKVLHTRSF